MKKRLTYCLTETMGYVKTISYEKKRFTNGKRLKRLHYLRITYWLTEK